MALLQDLSASVAETLFRIESHLASLPVAKDSSSLKSLYNFISLNLPLNRPLKGGGKLLARSPKRCEAWFSRELKIELWTFGRKEAEGPNFKSNIDWPEIVLWSTRNFGLLSSDWNGLCFTEERST